MAGMATTCIVQGHPRVGKRATSQRSGVGIHSVVIGVWETVWIGVRGTTSTVTLVGTVTAVTSSVLEIAYYRAAPVMATATVMRVATPACLDSTGVNV